MHIERKGGKFSRLAAQQRSDCVDRTPHIRRRRRFPRVRIAADQTGASFRFARLRQLHTADAARPPRDATSADSGVEKSKGARGHSAAILASVVAASISDLARYSAANRQAPRTPRASSATRLTTDRKSTRLN